ncbi:MAG TPA: 4-hydroxybenzoate 3-monooxygenase [Streptomyces sp.]|nr:4-hydroxybenzoate 3-monooxygenase [Streptomyces sp.]
MTTRTQVVIVGAGPAGLLLSHLLDREGVESVLLENRSPEYVRGRIRAGMLEHSTVDLLSEVGVGDRLKREGMEHRGIYLQFPHERHHIDFHSLVNRSVWVYGQTEITRDLMKARSAAGQQAYYEVSDVALHDIDGESPAVTFLDADGRPHRIHCDLVAGCDGFHGPSRRSIPEDVRSSFGRDYPYAWLGVLADVAPSTDELIYAWHPEGFAMHSMRSHSVSRLYLQVDPGDDIAEWSDDRIWDALARRLGHGQDGWQLQPGPITDKSVLPMRSFVSTPMQHGRLFLAGDAAHIVPPTGAKGLNLAVADVALLSRALVALLKERDPRPADEYTGTALRRVWRGTHFSWWMTSMLHVTGDPFDAQLQRSQLEWVVRSRSAAAALAENYAGLPIGY